jgi:hypothetical protein
MYSKTSSAAKNNPFWIQNGQDPNFKEGEAELGSCLQAAEKQAVKIAGGRIHADTYANCIGRAFPPIDSKKINSRRTHRSKSARNCFSESETASTRFKVPNTTKRHTRHVIYRSNPIALRAAGAGCPKKTIRKRAVLFSAAYFGLSQPDRNFLFSPFAAGKTLMLPYNT